MSQIDARGFRIWLESSYGLKKKSAGDAVSRFNRSLEIDGADSSLVANAKIDLFIKNLLSNPSFLTLPASSKSGMIRSLKLYGEYVAN